uniref:Crossover junction endonuclease MUS81 n=1 Tax=Parastrongyloides trichosuri TaxID=131310 RepID=A0A0N4ZER0_PARTI
MEEGMSKEIRIKVKKVYPRNLFFTKILRDWLEIADSKEMKRSLKTALDNVIKYPFHLKDYSELKQVSGIGNVLATRLDKAYRDLQCVIGDNPDITIIEGMQKGEALEMIKKVKNDGNNSKKSGISVKKVPSKTSIKTTLTQPLINFHINSQSNEDCMDLIKPLNLIPLSQQIDEDNLETSICFANPNDFGEVILICDIREQHGMNKHKSVVDHLIKDNVPFELMPLSVGDFLWIWRGGGKEIVLDYVIERKTWDDLKHSIRSKRLEDQKGRLKQCGIKNIVLLAEGKETFDFSLEQCLVSYSVIHKFLIHRTDNAADTATFLKVTTERLKERSKNEVFSGPDFNKYQDKNKKSVSETVRQVFAKQLTVCPQMSIEKALLITQKFPNMKSLWDLYTINNNKKPSERVDPKLLLNREISQIPPSLSAQIIPINTEEDGRFTNIYEDYEVCKEAMGFGKTKFVCDPDHSLKLDTVAKLEALLRELQINVKCPCAIGCPSRGSTDSDNFIGLLQVTTHDKINRTGKMFEEVSKDIYDREMLGVGECDNGIIILFTRDNNQLAVYSGKDKFTVLNQTDLNKIHDFATKGVLPEHGIALQAVLQSMNLATGGGIEEVKKSENTPMLIGFLIALLLFFIILAILLSICLSKTCCCFKEKHKERKGEYVVNPDHSTIMRSPEPVYVVPPSEYHMSPIHEDAIYSSPYSVPPIYTISRPTTPSSIHLNKIRPIPIYGDINTIGKIQSPSSLKTPLSPTSISKNTKTTISEDGSSSTIPITNEHHHDGTYQFLDPRRSMEIQTKEDFIE